MHASHPLHQYRYTATGLTQVLSCYICGRQYCTEDALKLESLPQLCHCAQCLCFVRTRGDWGSGTQRAVSSVHGQDYNCEIWSLRARPMASTFKLYVRYGTGSTLYGVQNTRNRSRRWCTLHWYGVVELRPAGQKSIHCPEACMMLHRCKAEPT